MTLSSHLNAALVSLTWLPSLQKLFQRVSSGSRVALVGGLLRDVLLKKPELSRDMDVVVEGTLSEVKALSQRVAKTLNAPWIPLDETHGIYRVVFSMSQWTGVASCEEDADDCWTLDLAQAEGGSIERDLHRRDFTVNALALDLNTFEWIDETGGLPDLLEHRVLRGIKATNFLEDPLRVLRGYRFLAQLGSPFTLESETLAWMQAAQPQLPQVAAERIQAEWLKLLAAPQVSPTLKRMVESRLLEQLLPELTPCRDIPPNTHHHLPLFEHTLELVSQLDWQWDSLSEPVQQWLLQPEGSGTNRLALVRWSCLLHDIGKPDTWAIDAETGQHRFIGHEAVGETLVGPIAQRFKLSTAHKQRLEHLVRWHLYPCQFGPDSTAKGVLRFFRRMGDATLDVTVLSMVDTLSTCGSAIPPEKTQASVANHRWLMEQFLNQSQTLSAPPLLSGTEVMALLELSPGPAVGQWLRRLREAQDLGLLKTPEQAQQWLRQSAQDSGASIH
jgi:poly(A) polymerase